MLNPVSIYVLTNKPIAAKIIKNMKVDINKLKRGQVELTIELTTEEYKPFLQQAAQTISEFTKIPGFRPGKAGYDIVEKTIGAEKIWQEAFEPAVRKTFVKALDDNQIITVGSPEIDIVKLAAGEPVIYKAKINLLPSVKIGDYSQIKIKGKILNIKDEQVKKVLSDLQKMHATESLVKREAKLGDKLEIDFNTFVDNIPIDNGKQEKFPLIIGEKTFIPGFEEQLIGLKEGETKEFQLKFPDNYHQKSVAGKLVDFKVKVNAVYQLDLPELNDEFATRLGAFKDFNDFKEKIKENITKEEEEKESRRIEDEILDKVIAQSLFDDIPDILINSEAKKMIEELEHNITHQGIQFDDYLNHLKKTRDELLLDFTEPAIKRVKSALLIRELVRKENITVSDQEIDQEIEKTIQMYGGNKDAEKQLKEPEYKNYLQNILTARKAVELLRSTIVQK